MEGNNKSGLWVLALFGVVIGVGWFISTRKSQPAAAAAYQPVRWLPQRAPLLGDPVASLSATPESTPGAHTYKNTETWEIEWTPDGLPGKVTIHRDAVQT